MLEFPLQQRGSFVSTDINVGDITVLGHYFIWLMSCVTSYRYSMALFFCFFYRCVYGCVFCILLYNSVGYVFLLLCLCILIVMYILFSSCQLAFSDYSD